MVSGYKVTRKGFSDEWELIGKKDPQLPQMFYPVASDLTLTKGDTVVRGRRGLGSVVGNG